MCFDNSLATICSYFFKSFLICNKVCEKVNTVLNPNVRFPFHSHSMRAHPLSGPHRSLCSSFIYFTASCHVERAKSESNSQDNQLYKAYVIFDILAVPFLGV